MKYEVFMITIKINSAMRKKIVISLFALAISANLLQAQSDTMYIMKAGVVVSKYNVSTQVDSIIFYSPASNPVNPISLQMANIPAGTFTMGSPTNEVSRNDNETEHQVTLSAFKMSKYEITNAQYAAFLNAKNIGGDGLYAAGAYPEQILIRASMDPYDWGVHYTNGQWIPAPGYENYPVIEVTWFGASEFATYVAGTLPTEAQWEYASRAGTTTPFNTGNCLTNLQANYFWADPYSTCTNTNTIFPGETQAAGTYAANAFGLFDMHGNVEEWCGDWYGNYSTTPQTNPTGPPSGSSHVVRGGSWDHEAMRCRSAYHYTENDEFSFPYAGFRVVLVP